MNLVYNDMMKYDISIIIPCYNREKTISRCINSIINQTIGFKNIELILVDDKSTDNTKNIIKEYSKKYENIKGIYLDKNSGNPGRPRNMGIKEATADYIMFIDSDDEYCPDICEKLFTEIKQENADIVSCNYINNAPDGSYKCGFEYKNGEKINNKIIITNDNIPYFNIDLIFCSIFKRSIIIENNITFPENSIAEDVWFMIKYLLNSNRLIYLNDYYGYLRHDHNDSTSHSVNIEEQIISWNLLEKCMELFPKNYDLSYRFKSHILWSYYHILSNNFISTNPKECYNFLKRLSKIENKMNFDNTLKIPFNIINWFVMHGNIKTAQFLLKTIYIYIYKNESVLKFLKKLLLYRN